MGLTDESRTPAQILFPNGSHNVAKAFELDRKIANWYLDAQTPLKCRMQTARRILLIWHVEDLSHEDPFQLSRLLKFDVHHLYLHSFVDRLVLALPVGIDPFAGRTWPFPAREDEGVTVEHKRRVFVDAIRNVWWRAKTSQAKLPPQAELLRRYYQIQGYLRDPESAPPPYPYRSKEETYKYDDLSGLVQRARMSWFANPGEFDAAYENNGKLEEGIPEPETDDDPTERVVWKLGEIGDAVEAQDFSTAAIEILACTLQSTPQTITTNLRKAVRTTVGLTLEECKEQWIAPLGDHPNWTELDEIQKLFDKATEEQGWNVHRELAWSQMAKSEKITRDEVSLLFD